MDGPVLSPEALFSRSKYYAVEGFADVLLDDDIHDIFNRS